MTKQQRKTIEKEFFKCDPSHTVSDTNLWETVFDRTLIVCESKPYRGKKLDEILKLLYIQHKQVYNICAALGICEDEFYKKKREIKEIALMEAKRLRLL